jgi:holin-like protein
MLQGLVAVVLFDLAGEAAARALHLPLPGPVVGMVLLVIALLVRDDLAVRFERGAGLLLRHMSLFFIPAGVGILAEGEMLRTEWLPISVAIAVSTLLALLTGAFAFMLAARGVHGARGARGEREG